MATVVPDSIFVKLLKGFQSQAILHTGTGEMHALESEVALSTTRAGYAVLTDRAGASEFAFNKLAFSYHEVTHEDGSAWHT